MLTHNPITVHVRDPEGHTLATLSLWRVPLPGDSLTVSLPDDSLVDGTVVHREWYAGHPDYVVITIEPDGWGDVSASVRMPEMPASELATPE